MEPIQAKRNTIGSRLDAAKGFGAGFDFLRVFLAFSVVAYHTCSVLSIPLENKRFLWFTHYWMLGLFFGLSGFLVSGSALRLPLRQFLINRGLRIIPALAVVVLISAFILGAIFTTLPIRAYFHDREVYHYMTNIIGFISYELPGVFKDHATPRVNISLWTVPFEIGCYAIIAGLVTFRLMNRPKLVLGLAGIFCLCGIGLLAFAALGWVDFDASFTSQKLYTIVCGRGSQLFIAFLLGVACYAWREIIPYNRAFFVACLGYCVAISALDPSWLNAGKYPIVFPVLNALVSVPLTYIMVFIGVTQMPRLPLYQHGDYSYGIYIYGFPVQQVLVSLLPTQNYALLLGAEIPAITLLAMFSWHFIEKPILRMRKKFSFVARERLEGDDTRPQEAPEVGLSMPGYSS